MTCGQIAAENLIERYLAGSIDDGLRDALEQHYFECDGCLASLQAVQAVKPVLAELPPPPLAKRRSAGLALAAAAAAATVVIVILAWPKPARETVATRPPATPAAPAAAPLLLLAEVQPAPYAPVVYRDGAVRPAPAFAAAMRLYQERQWKAAAEALEAVPGPPAEALHFAGVSRLLANDPAGALAHLDRVIALGTQSPFEEEARFYRAQALLVTGRASSAREDLQRVAEGRGDYEARARALLNRL